MLYNFKFKQIYQINFKYHIPKRVIEQEIGFFIYYYERNMAWVDRLDVF